MVNVVATLHDPRFRDILEKAVAFFSTLPGQSEEKGGYFCARVDECGAPEIVFRVGNFPIDKVHKYFSLSLEKGSRLYQHPEHLSSWQSRDEKGMVIGQSWGHWGGAIFLRHYLVCLSFSGLPELGDEAVVLFAALLSGMATLGEVRAIARISSNPYFELLYGKAVESRWLP